MSAARTDHEDLRDQAALYALGALVPPERQAFETHLVSCPECTADVRAFASTAAALADAVPQIDPPPDLRRRVLLSVAGYQSAPMQLPRVRTGATWLPWLAAAASFVAAVGLGLYTLQLRGQLASLNLALREAQIRADGAERDIANARLVASEAQATVRVIAAPDLQQSNLAGQQPVAPAASARAFWSRSRGLVFTASKLPQLPPGRTYQLWIVSAQPNQAPVSAGVFQPDASGRVETLITTPIDVARPAAMAVTIEPAGGVPAPTGDKYLVGSVSAL